MCNIKSVVNTFIVLLAIALLSACSSEKNDDASGKFTASPKNIIITPSDSKIVLSWDRIPDATYNVYMGTSSGVTRDVDSTTNFMAHKNVPIPFTHLNLANDNKYYFVVTATIDGNESTVSQEVSTVPFISRAPQNLTAEAGINSVTLAWDDIPYSSYNLYMDTQPGVTTQDSMSPDYMSHSNVSNPFKHVGLRATNSYYFVVTAVVNGVESVISQEVNARPTELSPPQNVRAVGSSNSVQIAWDPIAGAKYTLYMGTTSGVTKSPESTTNHMSHDDIPNPFLHTSLTNGLTYYFVVSATIDNVESAISAEVSAIPLPDVLPPPQNLIVTGNTTINSGSLSWDAVEFAAGYNVFRGLSTGVSKTNGTQVATGTTTTTFDDSGLAEATQYYYVVTAINDVSESVESNEISFTTLESLPAAPTALTANSTSAHQVVLSWNDDSNNEDGFIINRAAAGSGNYVAIIDNIATNSTSFSDSSVVPGNYYDYNIRAYNTGGDSSTSELLNVSVPLPSAPDGLKVEDVSLAGVSLSWLDSNQTSDSFIVERSEDGGNTWLKSWPLAGNILTFTDTTVVQDQSYLYRIIAQLKSVQSLPSTSVTVTVLPPPPVAPSQLAIGEVTSKQVPLSWVDNSDNESGFRIEYQLLQNSGTAGSWIAVTPNADADAIGFIDNQPLPGAKVNYRVIAFNSGGDSAPSNSVSTIVPPIDSDSFLAFSNKTAPRYQETAETAQAYYDAIDPLSEKTTVEAWKTLNGFVPDSGLPADTPAIYLNDADLGFGRRMYVNTDANGNVASYVENFSSLNEAIAGNPVDLIATVAMEYTQPALDEVLAAKKQVVLAKSDGAPIPAVATYNLDPGTYEIIVAREQMHSASVGPFTLNIKDNSGTILQSHSNEWLVPQLSSDNSARELDRANFKYLLSLTQRQSITFELLSDIKSTIYLRSSIGKVISEDDNSGGGVNSKVVVSLPAGNYFVIPTTTKKLTTNEYATISISSNLNPDLLSASGPAPHLVYYQPVNTNNPGSSLYRNFVDFFLDSPQDVTIELAANAGSTLDPYVYLIGATGTGADVIRTSNLNSTLRTIDYSRSKLTLELANGDYTVVAATPDYGQSGDFDLKILDESGIDIPINIQAPNFSWLSSGGSNPFSASNPKFPFTVSSTSDQPTNTVTIEISHAAGSSNTFTPQLYLLGDIGGYRHILAIDTELDSSPVPGTTTKTSASLATGQYTVVVGTDALGIQDDFELKVVDNNNVSLLTTDVVTGNWADSGGADYQSLDNPRFSFQVPANNTQVSIMVSSTKSSFPILWLIDGMDNLVTQAESSQFNESAIDTYLLPGNYQLIVATDDYNESSNFTLDITVDGVARPQRSGSFANSDRENPYSPNSPRLDLVITKNSRVTAQVNANVPVKLYLLGQGDQKITTFYTFIGEKGIALGNLQGVSPGNRVLSANLDGRGEKFQPGVCNVCHGGAPKSLVNGVYPDNGDSGAGFLAWDLDLFKYSTTDANFSRANLESKLKDYNKSVLAIRRAPFTGVGEGFESTRNTLIKGWYGGADLPNNEFAGNFIPDGWIPDSISGLNAGIPDGADRLYLDVVKPTCRLCHTQRDGVRKPIDGNFDNALSFGKYSDFISYQDRIEVTVYDQSTMPLALRTFDHFWNTGQAEILAQHLDASGFSHYDNAGNILQPGRPIANAGPSLVTGNRGVETGATTKLNGNASLFATSYNWTFTGSNPAGSTVILEGADTATPSFIPLDDAEYTFDLTVSNGVEISSISSVTVTAASRSTTPAISFANDILPKIDYTTGKYVTGTLSDCLRCHMNIEEHMWRGRNANRHSSRRLYGNSIYGISFTAPNDLVYSAFLDRINLNDPLQSLILRKPSNQTQHGGDQLLFGYGPSNPGEGSPSYIYYDRILQWILDGAQNN